MNRKKCTLYMLAGCALLGAYSLPAAADDGVYLALDFGQPHYSGNEFDQQNASTSTTSADRFAGGYQITPNWGIEAGYVDLGHGAVTVNSARYRIGAKGFFAAGTGTWPITQQWSLNARAGVIFSELDYQAQSTGISQGSRATDTASEATYGLGAKWNFHPQWALRLGFDHYRNLGNAGYSVNLLSLGVEWRFFK